MKDLFMCLLLSIYSINSVGSISYMATTISSAIYSSSWGYPVLVSTIKFILKHELSDWVLSLCFFSSRELQSRCHSAIRWSELDPCTRLPTLQIRYLRMHWGIPKGSKLQVPMVPGSYKALLLTVALLTPSSFPHFMYRLSIDDSRWFFFVQKEDDDNGNNNNNVNHILTYFCPYVHNTTNVTSLLDAVCSPRLKKGERGKGYTYISLKS